MSRDCPQKGTSPGRQPRKTVPFKRKARATETAEESSEEEDDVANMEDVRSDITDTTKVSKASTSKKVATSRIRSAQVTMPTLQAMIGHLSVEEKQEVFEGFLDQGF